MQRDQTISSILILGPTGSGKTPFGEVCVRKGLWGKRCLHFDFGASLRNHAEFSNHLSWTERDFVRSVLRTGSLLEDKDFFIAQKLIRGFMTDEAAGPRDMLLLNGLPRHLGQADAMAGMVDIRLVVHLDCSARVVRERIHCNAGGDRACRIDDTPAEVENKIRIFNQRTRPLLDYYRQAGARVETVCVQTDTDAEYVHRQLSDIDPFF